MEYLTQYLLPLAFFCVFYVLLLLLMFHLKRKTKEPTEYKTTKKKHQNQKSIKISLGKNNSHYKKTNK